MSSYSRQRKAGLLLRFLPSFHHRFVSFYLINAFVQLPLTRSAVPETLAPLATHYSNPPFASSHRVSLQQPATVLLRASGFWDTSAPSCLDLRLILVPRNSSSRATEFSSLVHCYHRRIMSSPRTTGLRKRLKFEPQCTHLTMTRIYGSGLLCKACQQPGPNGWIYACTQDREDLIEHAICRGERVH